MSGDIMKENIAAVRANEGRIQVDSYAGVGWLLLSMLLFGLVFLPVILL